MLLRRMIRNLIENAKLHGRPPIEVTVLKQDDRAVLNVLDHGPVIAEEARERLFSPFYRIPGSCATKGSGLGLALVRQIAHRHGGDVVYDPEQGSSFTVSLPATPEAAASPARTHSSI
jgi:signal transduction histidine kinase